MGIAFAAVVVGLLFGAVIHNRLGAVAAAAGAMMLLNMGLPAAEPFLAATSTGRRIVETLHHHGAGDVALLTLIGAGAFGVLVAWMLFGRSPEHRPDWEWDPDDPRYRRKRRRRMAHG